MGLVSIGDFTESSLKALTPNFSFQRFFFSIVQDLSLFPGPTGPGNLFFFFLQNERGKVCSHFIYVVEVDLIRRAPGTVLNRALLLGYGASLTFLQSNR